jgi:hypothetical protein
MRATTILSHAFAFFSGVALALAGVWKGVGGVLLVVGVTAAALGIPWALRALRVLEARMYWNRKMAGEDFRAAMREVELDPELEESVDAWRRRQRAADSECLARVRRARGAGGL